jgi:integrase
MNKTKITKALVDKTEPTKSDVIVWDTLVPGFFFKVTPTGTKTFGVYYRTQDGRQRKPKLGNVGILTVDIARDKARQVIADAASGIDFSRTRQDSRSRDLFRQYWERYLAEGKQRWKPTTYEKNEILGRLHIITRFGNLPLSELNRQDIASWHRSMKASPAKANQCLSILRASLNAAIEGGELSANPCTGIKAHRETARETYLTQDTLRAVLRAIEEEEAIGGIPSSKRDNEGKEESSRGISPAAAALFRLLIYTGARKSEIMGARWDYLDHERECLELPDSKTGAKRIWLNSLAMEQLAKLKKNNRGRWIIQGKIRGSRMVNAHRPWERVRNHAATIFKKMQEEAEANGAEIEGTPDQLRALRLHDLRHSFASIGVSAGIPLFVVGKSLGHSKSITTERYAHVANNPIREASERIAQEIRKATVEPAAPVIPVAKNGTA